MRGAAIGSLDVGLMPGAAVEGHGNMGMLACVVLCEGFRTPAVTNVTRARRPVSENLQGTKPRGGARIGAGRRAQLWGFGRGRATGAVGSAGARRFSDLRPVCR